jgi:lysophospholipase L1-like esterase
MCRNLIRALLLAVLGIMAALPVEQHAARAAGPVGPKAYYLVLGDSLAYGYQPNFDWSHGYSDDLETHLRMRWVANQVINMACPTETTATFIWGGCKYSWLHKYSYLGAQLSAALTFIRQHAGRVSPVTIDIGANDLLALMNSTTCSAPPMNTFNQALATFDGNFKAILWLLKATLNGQGDLVTMNYYFPYQNQCPLLLPLVQMFNAHLAADALGLQVPVADVFTAFGGMPTPNPNLCTFTWICSSYHDIHATSGGYAVIAAAFEAALGY